MTQDDTNLLTLNSFILLRSKETGKPYMDEGYGCYMFQKKEDAQEFVKGKDNIVLDEPKTFRQAEFCTEFYSYGIKVIHVKKRNEVKYREVPVEKEDTKKQYFNPDTNAAINLLHETKKKKYLRSLKDMEFIAPVLIDKRTKGQYQAVHYSYATMKGSVKYYVLFTTLQEFTKWCGTQEIKWEPLNVTMFSFERIRGKSPVLINPNTNKLVLNDKQLNIATGEKTK